MSGGKALFGRESVRLIAVAVVAAAIAVGVVEATKGSSHGSAAHGAGASSLTIAGGQTAQGATGGHSAGGTPATAVADGAAVVRSLRAGVMKVVIDTPPAGPLSEQNEAIEQGAEVAADEVDGSGGVLHGVKLDLVREDLDGLSASALKARLSADAAAALILPCDTPSEVSLAREAASFGTLMLAPCNADQEASRSYPGYWPVGSSPSDEAKALAIYMVERNIKRVFIVGVTGAGYAEQFTSAFRSAVQAEGIKIVGGASVPATGGNFSGVLSAYEGIRPLPTSIFAALAPPRADELALSFYHNGLHPVVLDSTVLDTAGALSTATLTPMQAVTFTSYGFARVDAAASRFAGEYRRDFARAPVGSFPGLGFEAIRLLAAAAAKGHSAEPSAIERALSSGLTLQGVALASRTYAKGTSHDPLTEVGLAKVYTSELYELLALSTEVLNRTVH
jgi:ABC-type branched-subunit amino acid transport system substrate-binding protein